MGKSRARFFAIIAAVCLALTLGLTACGESKTSVTLDKTALAIERFDTATITATVKGTTGEVVWSSDNEGVATVSGGVVTAVAAGVATITAKVGDASATCAVTVTDSGYFPVLNTGKSELSLIESATYTLTPSVTFRGNGVTASFTYEVADSAVTTVSDAGVITAVKAGTTTVTVRSSYVGYSLEETVTVKVMENSSITLSDSSVSLATSKPDGTDYLTSKTVTADVIDKGADGDASNIVWSTGSDTVATVSGGVITAVGEGTTTVTATYVTTSGKTITATVAVEVIIPVVKYDGSFDWDLGVSPKVQLDVNAIAGKTSDSVVRVEVDGTAVTSSVVDDKKIKLDGVTFGEKSVVVYFADIAYDVKVVAASKIITTKAELENLKSYATQVSTGVWDGYFVIDNDIDMAGGHFSNIQGWMNATNGTYGFKGTIDGQGHIISNVASGGETQNLVGYLLADGTVKNIGFVNATLTGKSPTLVAFRSYGTIENIFAVAERSVGSNNQFSGVIVNLSHADMKNCTVYVNDTNTTTGVVGSHVGNAETAFKFTNCWAVATLNYAGSGAKICGDGQKFTRTNSIGQRKSVEALKNRTKDRDLTKLDTTYWDITTYGVPVFKGFEKYVNAIAAINAPAEVNGGGGTVTLKANGRAAFEIVGETTAATITSVGKLTTAETVAEDTVVTVRIKSEFDTTKYTDVQITVKKTLPKETLSGTYVGELAKSLEIPTSGIEGEITEAKIGNTSLEFSATESGIEFTVAEVAKIGYGEKTVSILTADTEYVVSVDIYSKIITTKEDFLNMKSFLDETSSGAYGKIALGANIVLDEGTKFTTMYAHVNSANNYGFRGTFDGKGYTVSNLGGFNGISGTCGMFGAIGAGGVVKNVAFVNATIDGGNCGLFAMRSHGTFENVYVQGTRTASGNWSGALVGLNHGTMKNCVVNIDDTGAAAAKADGALFGNAETDCTIENCFAISSKSALVGNENGKTVTIANCGIAANAEAFAELADLDLSVLSADYWDTASGFPVFKTKA